jgi:hypothetical protein
VRRIDSMLRAVLLGLLAVSATSSCRGSSDTPVVAPGAAAGQVLEASGSVAATRDGATRPLAVGADVFADDVIDTGNGSVAILLRHNNARWAVESGQRVRVDESLAWKLAKQDGPARAVEHASSSAGREGERTAADTRATSETGESTRMRGISSGEGAERAPAATGAAAPPADSHAPRAPSPVTPAPQAPPPAAAPPPPPPSPPEPKAAATAASDIGGAGGASGAGAGRLGAAGGAGRAATADAAEESRAQPKAGVRALAPDVASEKKKAASATREPPPADTAPRAAAASAPELQLRSALEARRVELQRCLGGKLELTLEVRVAAGAPAIELTGGAEVAPIRACLERIVKQIPMAGLTATASIRLPR